MTVRRKGEGASSPPAAVAPADVATWFAGWRPPDADLLRLADSVNVCRKACDIERNPKQFPPLVSDLETEQLSAVGRDLARLQKNLPKVTATYEKLNALYDFPGIVSPKEPYSPELEAIKELQAAIDAVIKHFPAPQLGAPKGKAQKPRASGVPAPLPVVWTCIVGALGECIADILRASGRPASYYSPTGPLITVLCQALAAVEGTSPPADTLVSHFRRTPYRFAQNKIE